ncbi:MAG: 1-deoxy-D-xylulose-5-phosphate reductoisomerase [Candidatus Omnitrophota bacterium]
MVKKNIVILGSTGSIGESALDVVREHKKRFRVVGLSANANVVALSQQIREFKPEVAVLADSSRFKDMPAFVGRRTKILVGREGLCQLSSLKEADVVLLAVVGGEAIFPLLSALRAKKTIALANKEAVVMAGEMIRREAKRNHATIIPIDSEQSAIFQCLEGHDRQMVRKVILTASGGPLWQTPASRLKNVSLKQVLAHPRWRMGKKITVDSATLMNKGLEVIEAMHLFGLALDQVKVLVHRQALIHSLVEFIDGSLLAQLAKTDMRLPIQYALSYPERWVNERLQLDLAKQEDLSFEEPDTRRFPCLALALEAARRGGAAPCALNAANEVAVEAFLKRQLSFGQIPRLIEKILHEHDSGAPVRGLQDLFKIDREVRQCALRFVESAQKKGERS